MTELEKRGEDPNEESTAVPEGGGSIASERIRLYLERHPQTYNLANEIDWHDGYVGEDWPRRGYALARQDVDAILGETEEYVSEITELRMAYTTLSAEKKELLKYKEQSEQLTKLVQSMRLNGARHHFVYAHQQWIPEVGYVDHCRECGKEKGHPAHFSQGAKYMDSRAVEKAAEQALGRVEVFIKGLGVHQAPNIARELLKDVLDILPSIGADA